MRRPIGIMLVAFVLVACGGSSVPLAQQIVGSWRANDTQEIDTYTADGFRTAKKGFAPSCWSITGDRIRLVSPTADRDITWGIAIDGDTMTITPQLGRRTFTRVSTDDTVTPEQRAAFDTIKDLCPKP